MSEPGIWNILELTISMKYKVMTGAFSSRDTERVSRYLKNDHNTKVAQSIKCDKHQVI